FLDALGIFFGEIKPDENDACKSGDLSDMRIECTFDDLPNEIVLDAAHRTTLEDEYLLNADGLLEIHQVFNGALKAPKPTTFIHAVHPSRDGVKDILSLKRTQLKSRCQELGVDLAGVNQNLNAELRRAIREFVGDLEPVPQAIETDLEGTKELFPRIKEELPTCFLFRSDRASTDQDAEAQDPMKAAVRVALEQQGQTLSDLAEAVRIQVHELAERTLERIREMAPEIAEELRPDISPPKWDSIFKIALDSDSGIPLNKRGSGVRRLVLLGFLQAQAESHRLESPDRGIIYAIEEPETSQHPDKQRALLNALREISEGPGYQIMMTTHTPNLARYLPAAGLTFIERKPNGVRQIHDGSLDDTKDMIRKALGVHPDHDVRLFLGVEGTNDEQFLTRVSAILAQDDDEIVPISQLVSEGRLIFVPLGGSSLGQWVARLKNLHCRELYVLDRDVPPPALPRYESFAQEKNGMDGCAAYHTSKRELENYLHWDAINESLTEASVPEFGDFDDVPVLVASSVHEAGSEVPWGDLDDKKRSKKESSAKKRLNAEAVDAMTAERIDERDPDGDLRKWLREVTEIAMGS
ncbi:MAG: AAA family ATPase, partial [Haliea sp.]